jgi:hypothetical protein
MADPTGINSQVPNNASNLTTGTLSSTVMPAFGGDLSSGGGTTNILVISSNGVAIGPAGTAILGQIPGVATSSAASAGNVGEYTSVALSAASAILMSNGVATSVASMVLSAGDWDVWGSGFVHVQSLTVLTGLAVGISTVSNTALPGLTSGAEFQLGLGAGLTGGVDTGVNVGPTRISLAAAGTTFLNALGTFATSTTAVYGVMQARRRR